MFNFFGARGFDYLIEFVGCPLLTGKGPCITAKRYDPWTLETGDGTALFLYGFFSAERTLDNGYSVEVCASCSMFLVCTLANCSFG
jgi:hypothetical protein